MEVGDGDGIITTVGSTPPPSDIEISSVGSPEDSGFHEEAVVLPPPSSSSPPGDTIVLTDDLKEKIIRQVEYYFSDENLPTDKFLMKHVMKDREGFVPLSIIASFKKMKKLVPNKSLIVAALRESSQLILSSDEKRVRRANPLVITEVKDRKACTVFVENLPEDCSTENLQRIFGGVGSINNISIRDPHATEGSTKASKADLTISGKIHALVEYETPKEAEKAVAVLNDEKSWRNGMRVELLPKRMGKYGLAKKGKKEKNESVPTSSYVVGNEHNIKHDETPPEVDEGNHSLNENNMGRGRRSRGRGQFKGQKHYNGNGHGHGHGHGHGYGSSPSGGSREVVSKPPPGPKMPDGTRGFTMGRGRPLSSDL